MVGSRPTDKYASRDAFLAAFGVLGHRSRLQYFRQRRRRPSSSRLSPSDEALNKEVLYEFFKKYAEDNGLLNYETLYAGSRRMRSERLPRREPSGIATIQREPIRWRQLN